MSTAQPPDGSATPLGPGQGVVVDSEQGGRARPDPPDATLDEAPEAEVGPDADAVEAKPPAVVVAVYD